MRTGIEIVWWIGVVGALPATLVILKEAFLVVNVLRSIHKLAVDTHIAAQGIVVHTLPVPQLAPAGQILEQLDALVGEVNEALNGVAHRLESRRR